MDSKRKEVTKQLLPLYGFLEGDSLGILILGYTDDTVQILIDKLQTSAQLRVIRSKDVDLWYQGSKLSSEITLREAGIEAFERIDVKSRVSDGS